MTAAIFGAASGGSATMSAIVSYTGTGSALDLAFGFNPDLVFFLNGTGTARGNLAFDSVRGITKYIRFDKGVYTGEETSSSIITATSGSGVTLGTNAEVNTNAKIYYALAFKKAAQFLDIQAYAGNSTTNTAIAHNLAESPSVVAVMDRTRGIISGSSVNFPVWNGSAIADNWPAWNDVNQFSGSQDRFGASDHTSSNIYVTSNAEVNASGDNYISYVFGSGSGNFYQNTYSGSNVSDVTVTHASLQSPRFYIIKCTTTNAPWIVVSSVIGTNKYATFSNTSVEQTVASGTFTFNGGSLVIKGSPSEANFTGTGRNFRIWGFK
jgi:hypothetical protein